MNHPIKFDWLAIEKIYRDGYIQFWSIRLLYLAINGKQHPFGNSRIYDQYDVYERTDVCLVPGVRVRRRAVIKNSLPVAVHVRI